MKRCCRCRIDQPKTNFTKNKSLWDKLQAWCKSCAKAYASKSEGASRGLARRELTVVQRRTQRHLTPGVKSE